MDDLIAASASALARAIRAKQVSSAELVAAYLARLERVNPALNAVVQVCAEAAAAQARAADAALARGERLGPLHGVPFTVKDVFDAAGVVSAAGLPERAAFAPDRDATVVARLRAAGAILLGKTNCPPGGGGTSPTTRFTAAPTTPTTSGAPPAAAAAARRPSWRRPARRSAWQRLGRQHPRAGRRQDGRLAAAAAAGGAAELVGVVRAALDRVVGDAAATARRAVGLAQQDRSAARRRATTVASRSGTNPARSGSPAAETTPAASKTSLTVKGTPCSGPRRAAGERGVGGAGLGGGRLGADLDDGVERRIDALEPRQVGGDRSLEETCLARMARARAEADAAIRSSMAPPDRRARGRAPGASQARGGHRTPWPRCRSVGVAPSPAAGATLTSASTTSAT